MDTAVLARHNVPVELHPFFEDVVQDYENYVLKNGLIPDELMNWDWLRQHELSFDQVRRWFAPYGDPRENWSVLTEEGKALLTDLGVNVNAFGTNVV